MSSQLEIENVVASYFASIYEGDVARLRETFHPRAILSGEVKGAPYYKTLAEYLEGVRNRKSPQSLGEAMRMRVLSVDVIDQIAIAKTHSPMLGFNYIDLLSFVRYEGKWMIAAKVFTHVDAI